MWTSPLNKSRFNSRTHASSSVMMPEEKQLRILEPSVNLANTDVKVAVPGAEACTEGWELSSGKRLQRHRLSLQEDNYMQHGLQTTMTDSPDQDKYFVNVNNQNKYWFHRSGTSTQTLRMALNSRFDTKCFLTKLSSLHRGKSISLNSSPTKSTYTQAWPCAMGDKIGRLKYEY